MNETVLVTAAAGNVGREVANALLRHGRNVVASDYKTGRLSEIFGDRVGWVQLDFRDRSTWECALTGCAQMFLVRPPAISDVEDTLIPFLDFARGQGLQHVVFLSVAGAGKNRFVPHRKVEDHLRTQGIPYTNLRPGFFAQNLQDAYLQDIVEDNRIYVPAGKHKPVNWVDVRDVAEVAAIIFESPVSHLNESYTLAGPGAVPWSEVAAALSQALDREISYEAASLPGYILHLKRRGLPVAAIAVQTILHFLLRFGQGATEDPTLERLLGRRPKSIQQYIEDHAHVWAR